MNPSVEFLSATPSTPVADAVKRAVDIAGAIVLLTFFALPMILMAFAIKAASPGPILFRQKRVGRHQTYFNILKFRTMHANAEAMLEADPVMHEAYVNNGFKLPEGQDPRIAPIGRFLRKTSLDELPQLINVLLGSMSLVGPRPLLEAELQEHYGERTSLLLSVKPGMTGYWQVSGRSLVGYPQRTEIELYYVHNRSFWFDLKILLGTIPAVLLRRGAH